MSWALIDSASGAWLSGPLDDEPAPGAGQEVVPVSILYPDRQLWSPAKRGFVDVAVASPLMSVGRFKLLFTAAERIGLRAASAQSAEVFDFLDLLAGFTDGVSLGDPVLVASINHLAQAGLLTSSRATAILAGEVPA